jgi:DnaJ-domain-containing protein 1
MTEQGINPATKLPHTENYLRRQDQAKLRAEIENLLKHCQAKSKTRKRSVKALMAERGWERVSDAGPVEHQWKRKS